MTTLPNVFEIATRTKFRFPSSQGLLTTEQLWELPLAHQNAGVVTLDQVARTVNAQLKAVTEESFVATRQNAQQERLSQHLDVVKAVIAFKEDEAAARSKAADKAQEKARLIELLAQKDDEELRGLSRDEIAKRIAELD